MTDGRRIILGGFAWTGCTGRGDICRILAAACWYAGVGWTQQRGGGGVKHVDGVGGGNAKRSLLFETVVLFATGASVMNMHTMCSMFCLGARLVTDKNRH